MSEWIIAWKARILEPSKPKPSTVGELVIHNRQLALLNVFQHVLWSGAALHVGQENGWVLVLAVPVSALGQLGHFI
ncbi:MAG: hypothetical protein P8Z00_18395 [Anaerolineales bacterium]